MLDDFNSTLHAMVDKHQLFLTGFSYFPSQNLSTQYFMKWTVVAGVCCIPFSVIMFVWTSSFGFLVIMSIIGVLVSSLRNLIICVYIAIKMCIRR